MKKFFLLMMALMMAFTTLAAFAEGAPIDSPSADMLAEPVLMEGFVLEVREDSYLIQTRDGMLVEVLLTEDTTSEGKEIAVGDFIQVVFSGMMTRSMPAQITASHIRCHMLMGLVSDLTEEGFTLTFGEDVYQVLADAAMLTGIQDGMSVTLFYNGVMSRSIPAQVTALHIRGQEIIGTVTEMVEGGFILTVEGEELPYHVAIMENALQFVTAEPGLELVVVTDGLMTASLESVLVNAVEILPLPTAAELFDMAGTVTELGEGFVMIQTPDGQTVQANIAGETFFEGKEIALGDFIHVHYDGKMTRSIPAQINALKIGCYVHTGVVGEIVEGQFSLQNGEQIILVNAAAGQMAGIQTGMNVTVYSNGAMTMSLPAQVGAEMIVITQ